MSKRSAEEVPEVAAKVARITEPEGLTEPEVKVAEEVKIWLEAAQAVISMVQQRQFQGIRFPALPSQEATIHYLNAKRLTDEQVLKFQELCRQAPEWIRPYVDPTHKGFAATSKFHLNNSAWKVDPEFTQRYCNTTQIWPWLVSSCGTI